MMDDPDHSETVIAHIDGHHGGNDDDDDDQNDASDLMRDIGEIMWSHVTSCDPACLTGKHQFAMMEDNHDVVRKEQIQSRSQRSSAEQEQAKKWSCDFCIWLDLAYVTIGTNTTSRKLVLRISEILHHYNVFIRLVCLLYCYNLL